MSCPWSCSFRPHRRLGPTRVMAGETGRQLTVGTSRRAVRELAAADPQLAASVERYGPPPLWSREPSYATLVHLILEQQVSLASAQAAFDPVRRGVGGSVLPR